MLFEVDVRLIRCGISKGRSSLISGTKNRGMPRSLAR